MKKWTSRIAIFFVALAAGAMVLGDLLFAFAQAAEAQAQTTSVPAQVLMITQPEDRIEVAQAQRRRTLMDLLFGDPEPPPAPVVEKPVVTRPAPQASLPPPKPTIEKADGATRLSVFGDSMAVDLARALERHFADDPNIVVVSQGVGSSGFVRDDFFDWNKTIAEQIATDSFDVAVMIIGINDRQSMRVSGSNESALTPGWSAEYSSRVSSFVNQVRGAGKPLIWVGLPPMEAPSYATAISQISELQKLAVFGGGAEFLDTNDRFLNEDGKYSAMGPDLNGNRVRMRKDDGIHLSAAGADKLAFYLSQTLKLYYRGGGGVGLEVADPLAGTDAQLMVRPPYQGLGEIRLLEVAGAVIPLNRVTRRATDLVTAETASVTPAGFDMSLLVEAPIGRADAFGVGKRPAQTMNFGGR